MDTFDAAKVVHEKILKFETEQIARKVVGYVYLQDYPDQEMIRLALGPDYLIQNLLVKAKAALQLSSAAVCSPPISPSVNPISIPDHLLQYACVSSSSPRHRVLPPRLAGSRYWEHRPIEQQAVHKSDLEALSYSDSFLGEYQFQNKLMGSEEQFDAVDSAAAGFKDILLRHNQNVQGALDVPVKTCHYFNKGFCKHGSNCRYLHGQSLPQNYSYMFGSNANEFGYEDQVLSPGSLERLEMEITELLKSRGGGPISIASLPMLYFEKYGRTLQAEGYLTESQRHGKAGFSLTKLLARLNNTIRLIDRPHGQHAILLAEDAPMFLGVRGERNDPGPIVSGSRQIYLTFPAESTFTEEDVSNYFSTFGPVQDVRIPCQQKRMFGFVTFVSSDTVKIILTKGNPHYVCGARVLVKPYREKAKLFERKYYEKLDSSMYSSHDMDINFERQARFLRKQVNEEHEKVLQSQMARLSNLKLSQSPNANQSYFDRSMEELRVSQVIADHTMFPSAERFSHYMLNVLNDGPTTDDHHAKINYPEPDSNQGHDLPDSPFASVVAGSVSPVM
ncbi:RNA metabolism protein [Lithospermum erythrorhizon]|uniref:RNA metabolism protein n=1 Tax=Lithospermum erythrorhizon TaxID=34254 RepID=A0AAV3P253_LITER